MKNRKNPKNVIFLGERISKNSSKSNVYSKYKVQSGARHFFFEMPQASAINLKYSSSMRRISPLNLMINNGQV